LRIIPYGAGLANSSIAGGLPEIIMPLSYAVLTKAAASIGSSICSKKVVAKPQDRCHYATSAISTGPHVLIHHQYDASLAQRLCDCLCLKSLLQITLARAPANPLLFESVMLLIPRRT
jgi:hypothetical protein